MHCLWVGILDHHPVLDFRGTGIDSESEYVLVCSGTSLNGPSEMWTTSVKWIARKTLFDFSMRLIHFNLRETDSCNLSVPDNRHSARPMQNDRGCTKKPLRADRLKSHTTSYKKRHGSTCALRILHMFY